MDDKTRVLHLERKSDGKIATLKELIEVYETEELDEDAVYKYRLTEESKKANNWTTVQALRDNIQFSKELGESQMKVMWSKQL